MIIFNCRDNPEPNDRLSLTSDLSVVCFESTWNSMMVVGIAAVLLYCVLYSAALVRTIIMAPKMFHDVTFQRLWKFVFIKFRPDVYWWSLPLLLRAIAVNVGFTFIP